jgi:hypothetical protein
VARTGQSTHPLGYHIHYGDGPRRATAVFTAPFPPHNRNGQTGRSRHTAFIHHDPPAGYSRAIAFFPCAWLVAVLGSGPSHFASALEPRGGDLHPAG